MPILYKKAQTGLRTKLIQSVKEKDTTNTLKYGKAVTNKGWKTKRDIIKDDIKNLSSRYAGLVSDYKKNPEYALKKSYELVADKIKKKKDRMNKITSYLR